MSKYFLATLSLVSLSVGTVLPDGTANVPFNPPPHVPMQNASPGYLNLALLRKPIRPLLKPLSNLSQRQSVDPLENDVSGYSIQITVGTPPQIQWVDLDTGSNELWVNPDCSTSYYPPGCAANGKYVPGSSSTSHNLNKPFTIAYGYGSVSGTYYTDNMTMGGASIRQQQLGDASASQHMSQGILGIAWGNGVDTNYNNVIDNLKSQGITQSRAFGLGLGSIDLADGSIVFGGIDIMKFSGPLQKQPIIPRNLAPDGYARYWFYMNQVSITPPGATAPLLLTTPTYSQPMFPDSGSTWCQLPSALFTALLAYFPDGQTNQGYNSYTVSCNYRNQAGYINFSFGNVVIPVSYHEFIWFDGAQCWFAAQPSTQFYLLGDSFMRSAYIVYDQENSNILLAPAANCGTSILPISTGVDAVPSVTGLCAPTYTPRTSTTPTPTPSSSSEIKVSSTSSKLTSSSITSSRVISSSAVSTSILTTSSQVSSTGTTGTTKSSSPTLNSTTKVSSSSISSSTKSTSILATSSSTKTSSSTTSSVVSSSSNTKISSSTSSLNSISSSSSKLSSISTSATCVATTVTITSVLTVTATPVVTPITVTKSVTVSVTKSV